MPETVYEKIGDSYYCLYCGEKIEPTSVWEDPGYGTYYECNCDGFLKAAKIEKEIAVAEEEIKKLKNQKDHLLESSRKKINKIRYKAAVMDAAHKFNQPIPKK